MYVVWCGGRVVEGRGRYGKEMDRQMSKIIVTDNERERERERESTQKEN